MTSTGTGANKFALSNQATGDALVKASDIVAHLNTLSGDIQTAKGASQEQAQQAMWMLMATRSSMTVPITSTIKPKMMAQLIK